MAARHSEEIFRMLLADERIDPNTDIRGVLIAGTTLYHPRNKELVTRIEQAGPYGESRHWIAMRENVHPTKDSATVADILIRDERVDIERMELGTLRLFLWILDPYLKDRLDGYVKGATASGNTNYGREEVSRRIEDGTDLFSVVLRFIILKRPSGSELTKWMISQKNEKMILAARSIVEDTRVDDTEARWLRALLLIALYPTMDLEESLTFLKEERMDNGSIALAAKISGAYLGESGIRSRLK